jgi:tetratricopeptide (TPR) repeat protein
MRRILKSAFVGKKHRGRGDEREKEQKLMASPLQKEHKEKKVIEENERGVSNSRGRSLRRKNRKKQKRTVMEVNSGVHSMELETPERIPPPLPDDMICTVFAFLDVKDLLLKASLVCKKWQDMICCGRVYLLDQWVNRKDTIKNSRWRTEGRNHFDKKQWNESIDAFSKAIILNPRGVLFVSYSPTLLDHLAYFWRAYAYDQSNKYTLAVKDFSKSLQFEPEDATAYSNRGATYR